ncbi:plasmid replication protein RepC [Paracoccus sp. AK26]|uniref:plasmid replication protein RepC n=1 Tax=Paracoccus sp. AK26 TaxID=2589076 RepID=UPI00142FF0F0|nr:plasmid replication protein RepC [Paracoccus sp. AK26]
MPCDIANETYFHHLTRAAGGSASSFGGRNALAASRQQSVDKWSLIQDLTDGREALGLTDRNLSVLSALLSFYPGRELRSGALTVFPSNASLSARLHGMPESTLRRHLAALCQASLINRCDSPNGKRYATRDGQGRIDRVFGFDLRPLLDRAAEIAEAAEDARETRRLVRKTRQSISLLLRDLALSSAEPGNAVRGVPGPNCSE